MREERWSRRAGAAAALLLAAAGGCANAEYGSAARDPLRMPDPAEVAERSGYLSRNYLRPASAYREAVVARIGELAERPMTEAAAVEVALLQDRGVRLLVNEYWGLRPSVVAAVAETAADAEDARPVEWKILGQILAKSATDRWNQDFAEEYLDAAGTVLHTATVARQAYYGAVAAAQLSTMYNRVLEANAAAAILANEQYRAGTTSRLDQARQHLAYAKTFKASVQARTEAVAKREELNRLLRLHGRGTTWALPDRLPDLPEERPVIEGVEAYAVEHGLEAHAGSAGPRQLEVGATMRSEVREAYVRMLAAYDIARYQRDVILPLTQIILEEMQLTYNAMLDDIYGLLDATQGQIEAGQDYVVTLAEFWAASADLAHRLGGRLPEGTPGVGGTAAAVVATGATPPPSVH